MRKLSIVTLILLAFFPTLVSSAPTAEEIFTHSYAGRIIVETGANNEGWYVDPVGLGRVYLGSPEEALLVLTSLGIGISNKDFTKIPLEGERRIGRRALLRRLAGRVVVKVQDKGKPYYIHPLTYKAIPLLTTVDVGKLINQRALSLSATRLEQIGLSDYNPWLSDNNSNDADKDGFTDLQELRAGTSPFRPTPPVAYNQVNVLRTASRYSVRPPSDATVATAAAEFVPGQVVIKFKSKTIADLIENNLAKPNAEVFLSKFLSRLGARDTNLPIKVRKIESIFEHLERQLRLGKKTESGLIQQISRRFAQRAHRAAGPAKLFKAVDWHKITFDKSVKVEDILSQLNKSPEIEYAEPNFIYKSFGIPNDPYYSSQNSWGQNYDDLWGLKKIQAAPAWDMAEGAGKVVAVVDTGLDYNHADIKSNVWINTKEIAGNGLDDDGNGFIDDIRGWDFTTCEIFGDDCAKTKPEDNDPVDGDGHGTHVSGTIAAVGNNGLGVIGVAPKAKIMAVKGLNDQGAGASADLAAAIRYAADNGADVINMSWGGIGSSRAIEDAVNYAASLGVVLVAAAGNSSQDVSPGFYPANYSQVIAVAATDENDRRSTFSNYGAKVLMAAPGGGHTDSSANKIYRNILSLRSGTTDMYGDGVDVVGENYYRSRGTSMASPHVAGAAALLLSANSTWTREQVAQILQASADDVESPGPDLFTGSGRINAAAALNIKSTPIVGITRPTDDSVLVRSVGSVNIEGTASGNNFSNYQLSYWSENLSYWIAIGGVATAPVENNLLGVWNIKDLPVGFYLLRLSVTDKAGQTFSKIVRVEIENYFPEPVSTTAGFQVKPRISGDLIVWSDFPNPMTPEALFVYDLADKTETQLTDRSLAAQTPDISGNRIVWRSYPGASDIYLCTYNRSTKQCAIEQITSDGASQAEPAIDGNKIVWQDNRNGNWDIYMHDLSNGVTEQLTFDSNNQSNPDIFGNLIVWEDWVGTNPGSDVYLYDLSKKSLRQLTNNSAWQGNPAVSGNRVVWEDRRGGNPDIYTCTFDANTGQCPEEKLTDGGVFRTNPEISDNRVVWREVKNGNEDIYLYDIAKVATGTEAITSNKSVQQLPVIDKNRVVWEDSRNSSPPWAFWDIYMAELGAAAEPATTTPPVIPTPEPIPVTDKIFSFTFPVGGELLEIGRTYNIKWQTASTTADLSTVRLSLYRDESFKDFVALDIPNNGSYAWAVPALTVGSGYNLRLFNLSYPNNFSDSGIFSVTSAATSTPPSSIPNPQPDLLIYDFSTSPKNDSYLKSDAFSLNFVVKNNGNKESGQFKLSVKNRTNSWDLGQITFNSLVPGSSWGHDMSWSSLYWTAEGDNLIELKVDGDNLVNELNEDNNMTTFGIRVSTNATSTTPTLPRGNLTASSVPSISGTTARVVTLSGAVSNLGSGNYITKYEWDYTSDGVYDYVSAGAIPQSSVDHRYVASGAYTATFRATDNLGRQATATMQVYITL